MTGRTFLNGLTRSSEDIVQILLLMLDEVRAEYCIIGGLAVNAYAEPVVSLDLDLVVIADRIDDLRNLAVSRGMKVQEFPHSLNLSLPVSDLRIQIQTDPRYQEFLSRSQKHDVLGYSMTVAALEDILRGKIWAFKDMTRRASKRQKDLSDIMRLVETHPELQANLPSEIAGLM